MKFDGYFVEIVKDLGRVNGNFKNRSYLGETDMCSQFCCFRCADMF